MRYREAAEKLQALHLEIMSDSVIKAKLLFFYTKDLCRFYIVTT